MFLKPPPATDEAEQLLRADTAGGGHVMNLTRAWAWRPDVATAFAGLRRELMRRSLLSQREGTIAACAAVAQLGDAYCALGFGSVLAAMAGAPAAAAVLRGAEPEALTARERAIAAWARQVARDPNAITPAHVAALRAAGLRDREVFELTAFIAFRLAFAIVNDALGCQPDHQIAAAAPPEVRAAVDFGRPPAAAPPATFIATGTP